MAKVVYRLNQSLDGYVDHDNAAFMPCPVLFRHFIEQVRGVTGSIYGRGMYELMRYWDGDDPAWTPERREYAEVWRKQPKWVASRTLTSVGPNATLVTEQDVRKLKADLEGEIQLGGPHLAHSWRELIDEFQLYVHPVVLGQGRPFFLGPHPPLRLVASEPIGEHVVRLTYR